MIKGVLLGNDFIDNSKRGRTLTASDIIILSIAVSISNGVMNFSLYGEMYTGILDIHFITILPFTFVSATISSSVMFFLLYLINSKGQLMIEKKLSEEDTGE